MAEPRVILIGADGLDLALFLPLVSAGLMPNLAALMRRGCHGPLTPVLSDCAPACWATLV
ncbi:MAG: alkaline phosphatase family protein, partial [Rhodocyclaceae bacterium]|nr:alkaline phosphatase family protein [Rhodocyclaceae bacterium]